MLPLTQTPRKTVFISGGAGEVGEGLVRNWIADEAGRLDAVMALLGGWWQDRPLTDLSLDTWPEDWAAVRMIRRPAKEMAYCL